MPELLHVYDNAYSRGPVTFEETRREKGFTYIVLDRWGTSQTEILPHEATILSETYRNRSFEQIRLTDTYVAVVNLDIRDSHVAVQVAAESAEEARAALSSIVREFPQRPKTEGLVPITFWANTARGPHAYEREISAQRWEEIEANYPASTKTVLDEIISGYTATPEGGKLLLFSGPAGTGKTHFVRSLAMSWRDTFDMHYVTDPDHFFGGGAEYLFDVPMAGDSEKWKLLVCEDTGELVSQDAKIKSGQALSRFLNLADGMIGQGLRIQILLTTNEDISRFHEAVVRPGRIAYNVVFPKFPKLEASKWLGLPVNRDMTLAEMYAVKRGEEVPIERRIGII